MFKTQYDDHDRVNSNVGNPEHILYSPVFDKDGNMELVESGRENIYDFIQSHKDSVDIHQILRRFEEGDVDALSRRQGIFADFTSMPATYADALNAVIAAQNYFNGLPVDVRAKYDHSFEKFLASLDKDVLSDLDKQTGQIPDAPTDVGSSGADPSLVGVSDLTGGKE